MSIVHPLAALPVQKCFFYSPGHWIILCFYRQRQRLPLLKPRRQMPARPRSKFSLVTIILLDTSKEIYCILNLFQPILFEILETLTAPGIKVSKVGFKDIRAVQCTQTIK